MKMANVEDLVLPQHNHEPLDVRWMCESLMRNGLVKPISISETNEVLAGVCRVLAFRLLGWTMIPAVVHGREDTAKIKEADNLKF
jgi:ParB-like chromosome segregation protein Spo0J